MPYPYVDFFKNLKNHYRYEFILTIYEIFFTWHTLVKFGVNYFSHFAESGAVDLYLNLFHA